MTESHSSPRPVGLQTGTQQVGSGDHLWIARNPRPVSGDRPQMDTSADVFAAHKSPLIGRRDESSEFIPSCLSDGDATTDVVHPAVEISPPDGVRRRTVTGHGMAAESVQSTSRRKTEYRFCAPMHLLVVHEEGERRDGETFVEGLSRSTLRNLNRKMTFVPAGHEYYEWHEPRRYTRLMHFYFDPAKLNICSGIGIAEVSAAPRLLFEDETLWHTGLKLKTLIESPASADHLYFETLGTLLVHELVRLNRGVPSIQPRVRGGLAPWQQRIVTAYIEEHLNERIPLATLAKLVRLSSTYHFCRAFKQSFGMPPHRYHCYRRMEHAKLLLARRAVSVTNIGLTLGFGSPNAFATAFRKATGFSPTDYRRSLAPGFDTMCRPVGRTISGSRA